DDGFERRAGRGIPPTDAAVGGGGKHSASVTTERRGEDRTATGDGELCLADGAAVDADCAAASTLAGDHEPATVAGPALRGDFRSPRISAAGTVRAMVVTRDQRSVCRIPQTDDVVGVQRHDTAPVGAEGSSAHGRVVLAQDVAKAAPADERLSEEELGNRQLS